MAKRFTFQPQLSPENYIRKKARNLPVYKCFVNENWKELGMANCLVARQHASGKFTFALYMVDLFCLGMRDTVYYYNETEEQLKHFYEENAAGPALSEVSYALVHNIIYSGIAYAQDLGFQPHKNFAVSRFIIDEDTDEVELIEIECGMNGKPLFVHNGDVSAKVFDQTIERLTKAVGEGNFEVLDLRQLESEQDEEEERLYTGYSAMESKERKKLFFELLDRETENEDEGDDKLYTQLELLTEVILTLDLTDALTAQKLEEEFNREMNWPKSKQLITPEFFGFPKPVVLTQDDISVCELLMPRITTLPIKQQKSILAGLRKKLGDCALFTFLEITRLTDEHGMVRIKDVQDALKKFPDYPLLKLEECKGIFYLNAKMKSNNSNSLTKLPELNDFFPENYAINDFELFQYYVFKLFAIQTNHDLNALLAIGECIYTNIHNEALRLELEEAYFNIEIEMVDKELRAKIL